MNYPTKTEKLLAKVKAVNRANREAIDLYKKLITVFTEFLGKKVTKVDGTLIQKIQNLIPTFSNTTSLQIYRRRSDYSIDYIVKTCENIGEQFGCLYHETNVGIAELKDGVIEKLYPYPNYRTNYTVEEIEGLRETYETAKKAASEAEYALYPFGASEN